VKAAREATNVLAAHAPPTLRFAHRGRSLVFRTNDDTVYRYARASFEPMLDAGTRLFDHHASVWIDGLKIDVRLDDETFFRGVVPAEQHGKAVAAAYAVRELFARWATTNVPAAISGTALRVGRSGILLLGAPGSGKTVLAVLLASLGAELLGDDIALLDTDLLLDGLPRRLTIHESALPFLGEAGARLNHRSDYAIVQPDGLAWCDVKPEALGVREALLPAPLRAIVTLERARETVPVLEIVPPAAGALDLARFRYRKTRTAHELTRAVTAGSVVAMRVRCGDPLTTARQLYAALLESTA
jgi:hypothetical protein